MCVCVCVILHVYTVLSKLFSHGSIANFQQSTAYKRMVRITFSTDEKLISLLYYLFIIFCRWASDGERKIRDKSKKWPCKSFWFWFLLLSNQFFPPIQGKYSYIEFLHSLITWNHEENFQRNLKEYSEDDQPARNT